MPAVNLNKDLIKSQGLDQRKVDQLEYLHEDKQIVFEQMELTDDPIRLRYLAKEVTFIELQLQRTWGFELNEDYHLWYLVPKCKCPRMDNEERRGTPYKIINEKCPVHGYNLVNPRIKKGLSY